MVPIGESPKAMKGFTGHFPGRSMGRCRWDSDKLGATSVYARCWYVEKRSYWAIDGVAGCLG